MAELAHRPEGYIFSWVDQLGRNHTAPLITPPDRVAVQRQDGTWHRITRSVARDEPVPYSQVWYAQYLRHYNLPAYFMRRGHLDMLYDDYEANVLGMQNAPSPHYAVIPPHDYLLHQYPAVPLWPSSDQSGVYQIRDIPSDSRAILSRYSPALSVTGFRYDVYVWPSGNIQVRSTIESEYQDCPVRDANDPDRAWISWDEDGRVPSSYHRDLPRLQPGSDDLSTDARRTLIQERADEHCLINPMEDVPGDGRLEFLHDSDQQRAVAMGFVDENGEADAQQVTLARRRGELAVGTGHNAGPVVIFRPNPDLRNPRDDPQGPGRWEFLTSDGPTSNRGLAAINLGGSNGLPTYPNARQIRLLGQMLVADGRVDLTAMIDIVWVAGEEDNEPGVDPVLDAPPAPEEEQNVVPSHPVSAIRDPPRTNSVSSPAPIPAAGQSAPPNDVSGQPAIPHEPTNGNPSGPHDQTGQWAKYETGNSRGQRITIDRSRAWVGYPEPHKLWTFGSRGWKRWLHADTMDWSDKKKVGNLNKHREQANQRAHWNPLRKQARTDYTFEENTFVMDMVKQANGERPKMPIGDIAREFNSRFGARCTRNDTALQSLIDRLRKEFQEHGGLKKRQPRGHLQKIRSDMLRNAGGFGPSGYDQEQGEDGEEDASGEEGRDDASGEENEEDAPGEEEDDEEDALGEDDDEL